MPAVVFVEPVMEGLEQFLVDDRSLKHVVKHVAGQFGEVFDGVLSERADVGLHHFLVRLARGGRRHDRGSVGGQAHQQQAGGKEVIQSKRHERDTGRILSEVTMMRLSYRPAYPCLPACHYFDAMDEP